MKSSEELLREIVSSSKYADVVEAAKKALSAKTTISRLEFLGMADSVLAFWREKIRGQPSEGGNVTSIYKNETDDSPLSPKETLESCMATIGKKGALKKGDKLLILALDDTNGHYSVSFFQSNMKMSECLSLTQVGGSLFLTEMNYIPEKDT